MAAFGDYDIASAIYWSAQNNCTTCLQALSWHLEESPHGRVNESTTCYGSALAVAVDRGHRDTVSILLCGDRADPNRPGADGRTPLATAAARSHTEIISILLKDERVDANITDPRGVSPFFLACTDRSNRAVDPFLSCSKVDVSRKDNTGWNALSWACAFGPTRTVKMLLRRVEIDVNNVDSEGNSPLLRAVVEGRTDVVKILTNMLRVILARAPDTANSRDISGWSPLAWTFEPPGFPACLEVLLQYASAETLACTDYSGRTLLSIAVLWGQTAMVKMLLDHTGVDVHSRDLDGHTALFHAVKVGAVDIVRQLISRSHGPLSSHDVSAMVTVAEAHGNTEILAEVRSLVGKND
ncbi:ankyrin repeat-containing domain protein [Elsinoe ampelina]|uniref:Ankyrin repeat-containing domain protein n=1 Tax=Elsinoe ampelina TaxID=302913 RepID=A0A6A6GDR2_9PEZI|nr:ankyrin repeat-containing domain protein [Elsinoe ampelina]